MKGEGSKGYVMQSANKASMHSDSERAWVEIDLGALQQNGATIAALARVPLLPMVKADAYGLGAEKVAGALEKLDPWGFGIATVEEGIQLRAAGVRRPILVFTPILQSEIQAAKEHSLTPVLGSSEAIAAWGESENWHLAIDTGMNRAGIPWREVGSLASLLKQFPPAGACTHYHSAQLDDGTLEVQENRFEKALDLLPVRPRVLHCEASAAIVRKSPSKWSFVRPGIFLYGVGSGKSPEPKPVVQMRAAVVEIRDLQPGDTVSYDATFTAARPMRIATVAAGYSDGYPRALSNRANALLRGATVKLTGRVTMDMTMFDVSEVRCNVGDIVTLIGRDANETITVAQIGEWAEMSPYEVLTGLKSRISRTYSS